MTTEGLPGSHASTPVAASTPVEESDQPVRRSLSAPNEQPERTRGAQARPWLLGAGCALGVLLAVLAGRSRMSRRRRERHSPRGIARAGVAGIISGAETLRTSVSAGAEAAREGAGESLQAARESVSVGVERAKERLEAHREAELACCERRDKRNEQARIEHAREISPGLVRTVATRALLIKAMGGTK